MDKMGYPKGLIRYSTEAELESHAGVKSIAARLVRPRTTIYGSILAIVLTAAAVALFVRVPLKVDVIRDRGSLVREVENGELENVYRLQVMNATEAPHRYHLEVEGLAGLYVASERDFLLEPASTRAIPVRVRVPRGELKNGSHKVAITVAAEKSDIRVTEKSVFLVR
jgi:polyferredoxin